MTLTARPLTADLTAARGATALTLSAALSSAAVEVPITVQIGEELMLVERRAHRTNPQVVRGFAGSAIAFHASGATVTPVQIVVQTDAPTAPPPATAGGGAAASIFYAPSDEDPGAVGPGALWVQSNAGDGGDDYFQLLVRNEDDDDWIVVSAIIETDGETFATIASPHDEIEIQLNEGADQLSLSATARTQVNSAVFSLSGLVDFLRGDVDPTAGAGVVAPVSSLYFRDVGPGAGSLWLKVGVGDTAWVSFIGLTGGVFTAPGSLSLNATTNATLRANGGAVDIVAVGNLVKLTATGLTLNDLPIGTQAAHVADGSTVDDLRDALIASGLMAAS